MRVHGVRAAARTAIAATAIVHGLVAGEPAWGARWQDVMGVEPDSAVFLLAGGELVRGPFHLRDRDTLWVPRDGERISRFLAAPDGRQIAWLSRRGDRSPTALWVGGRGFAHPMMTFPGLVPGDYGSLYFEPAVPTLSDPIVRGARLVTPSPMGRGMSSNALEWTLDGRTVLCGSSRGLIQSPADTGAVRFLSEDRMIALRRLSPSPIYLGHLLQVRAGSRVRSVSPADPPPTEEGKEPSDYPRSQRIPEGSRTDDPALFEEKTSVERRVLLYLVGGRVRMFDSSGLDPSDAWTASFETVWWIDENTVHAVRARNPEATVEIQAGSPIAWIEYDPRRQALLWVAKGRVSARSETEARDSLIFDVGSPVRRVITPARGTVRALVTDAGLVLWDLADDSRHTFESPGLRATGLFVTPNGNTFVVATGGALRGAPLELYRVDSQAGRLERVPIPALKGARLAATPSCALLVLYRPGSRPPASLQVYDPAAGAWTEVENPGIVAWEPLGE